MAFQVAVKLTRWEELIRVSSCCCCVVPMGLEGVVFRAARCTSANHDSYGRSKRFAANLMIIEKRNDRCRSVISTCGELTLLNLASRSAFTS